MQNGINDALLEQVVPRRQIVTCVTLLLAVHSSSRASL